MHDISKTISEYVEHQFPDVYRTEGAELVKFAEAYFEFLETEGYSTYFSRDAFAIRDIDESMDQFLVQFKEMFLSGFTFSTRVDKRFMIKHIMDYYRSKGTPRAAELLIKFMFDDEVTVYYPGEDVWKLSASEWIIPRYVEVSRSVRTPSFLDQQITGSTSGAKAFVEGIATKRIQGRYIDVLYLSDIRGTFSTGELVTDDGTLEDAPIVIGSLSSLTVVNGGRDNVVGDVFNVVSDTGRQGLARVSATQDATGRVDFNIVDGGSGYTLNTPFDANTNNDYTDVLVADAMFSIDNIDIATNPFIFRETVQQLRERLNLLSATDLNTSYQSFTPGDYLVGVKTYVETTVSANATQDEFPRNAQQTTDLIVTADDVLVNASDYSSNTTTVTFNTPPGAGVTVKAVNFVRAANGIIASSANTDAAFSVISEASANNQSVVVLTEGTFANQISLDFTTSSAPFADGETIYEESDISLNIDNATLNGTFSVSETVKQVVVDGSLVTNYAEGVITSVNSTVMELSPAFGTFESGETVVGQTSSANVEVTSQSVTLAGATGILTEQTDANTWVVNSILGSFTVGKLVLGGQTLIQEEISAVSVTGASDIWYNGVPSSNGIVDTVANTSVEGIVVAQNSTALGLFGNTTAFSYIEGAGMTLDTIRYTIPGHNITAQPELSYTILEVFTGQDATFEPGSLENEEIMTLNTDLLGGYNVANVPYTSVGLDGSNSGIGFVDNITINDGGTGYTDGTTATFTGGGYAGGNPAVSASGTLNVTAGVIDSITVDVPGYAYYETPTIVLPDNGGGTDATVTVNMDFGYGFPKDPNGDDATLINNTLTYDTVTIGTITSLTLINPGSQYNIDPFVAVHNPLIAGYNRKEILLGITIISGSFAVGEAVYQNSILKGTVIEANSTVMTLKRSSFNTSFDTVNPISGAESSSTATVLSVDVVEDSLAMGNNAIITANTIQANGVATSLEVLDSGYGYLDDIEVSLVSPNTVFVVTAQSSVQTQGLGTGYWRDKDSHISTTKKIHDNKYYQEYSYDIQTGLSLNRYRKIVLEVLHVAGTRLFGSVFKRSTANVEVTAATTTENTVSIV